MMSQEVRDWCYRQCAIQHATDPADIAGMENAWDFAVYMSKYPLRLGAIRDMASLVDPVANPNGRFRTGPAVFMNGGTAARAAVIQEMLTRLMEHGAFLSPQEFYNELMFIHPFKDGNGRVGALVYNVLNGTIENPVDPPEYA